MKTKFLMLAALASLTVRGFGADLWNQLAAFDTSGGYFFWDADYTYDQPDATYQVSDVIVGSGGWDVSSIQTAIFSTDRPGALGVTQAVLNVYANNGTALPTNGTDNPQNGSLVDVTVVQDPSFSNNTFHLTATGLNLQLSAGEYWIGLTPVYTNDTVNPDIYASCNSLTNSAGANYGSVFQNPQGQAGIGNPLTWYDVAPDEGQSSPVYEAMDIQGTPEPCTLGVLALCAGGAVARRRPRWAARLSKALPSQD